MAQGSNSQQQVLNSMDHFAHKRKSKIRVIIHLQPTQAGAALCVLRTALQSVGTQNYIRYIGLKVDGPWHKAQDVFYR